MAERIVVPDVMFGAKGKERLVFSAYNGRMSLTIFGPQGGRPDFGENMAIADILRIRKMLGEVSSMSTGNQRSLKLKKFQDGSFNVVGAICVGRTDENLCYVEIQFDQNGQKRTARFETVAGGVLEYSDKDFDMATATGEGMQVLEWWFDNVLPAAMVKTAMPRPTGGAPRGGNNGGGGGHY